MRKLTFSIAALVVFLAASATGLFAQSAHGPMMHQSRMGAGDTGKKGPGMGPGMGPSMGPEMMRHGMMMRMMMIMIDTDGDGAVSSTELQAVVGRFFKAVDTNNDGKLTFEEVQEHMRNCCAAPKQAQ